MATLRTADKVAHLLIPTLGAYDDRREAVDALLARRTLGGIFVGMADCDQHREEIARLPARCAMPLVVASDLEAGAGHFVRSGVPFPEPLAVAAANDTQLAYPLCGGSTWPEPSPMLPTWTRWLKQCRAL